MGCADHVNGWVTDTWLGEGGPEALQLPSVLADLSSLESVLAGLSSLGSVLADLSSLGSVLDEAAVPEAELYTQEDATQNQWQVLGSEGHVANCPQACCLDTLQGFGPSSSL